jgi:hypothetical protein
LSLPFALWNRRAVMQLIKVLFDANSGASWTAIPAEAGQ